jgi:hypothetical protein
MRRAMLGALAVVVAALVAPVASLPGGAAACSIAFFHRAYLDDTVGRADVIAVGTFEEPVDDAIPLVVSEGLKGALTGDVLLIDNTQPLNCMTPPAPRRANYRQGDRVLVFLEDAHEGPADYQVHRFGLDIFLVEEDVVAPYPGVNDGFIREVPRLEAVREEFTRKSGGSYESTVESAGPCNPPALHPAALDDWARMAEAMVIGTSAGQSGATTLIKVDEVYRGDVGPEILLNDHAFGQAGDGCEPVMQSNRRDFPIGAKVALLLVRDEFGVGEWRPAVWGLGAWELNDSEAPRYEGIPPLSEVRASVERVEGVTLPVAPPDDAEEVVETAAPDEGTQRWIFLLAVGAALAAMGAVGVAVVVRRRAP